MPAATPLDRLRSAYPGLDLATVQPIGDGLVNDILVVNGERVFRFPKNNTWAQALFEHELRVLALLRGRVSLPLPYYDIVEAGYGAYRLIPGEPLCREDILAQPERTQDGLAEQLAGFLGQMHTTPLADAAAHGIGPSDVNRGRDAWLALLADVQRELFPHMLPLSRIWIQRHFAPLVAEEHFMDYAPALINGDLASYHILWDAVSRQVTGLIDFGTAGVGDPAADLACLIYSYGESFLRRMARYDPGLVSAVDRARFWAGTMELQWLLHGAREQQLDWHTAHIGGAKDVGLIGSAF